jgi:hypothetical protein
MRRIWIEVPGPMIFFSRSISVIFYISTSMHNQKKKSMNGNTKCTSFFIGLMPRTLIRSDLELIADQDFFLSNPNPTPIRRGKTRKTIAKLLQKIQMLSGET